MKKIRLIFAALFYTLLFLPMFAIVQENQSAKPNFVKTKIIFFRQVFLKDYFYLCGKVLTTIACKRIIYKSVGRQLRICFDFVLLHRRQ